MGKYARLHAAGEMFIGPLTPANPRSADHDFTVHWWRTTYSHISAVPFWKVLSQFPKGSGAEEIEDAGSDGSDDCEDGTDSEENEDCW
jgi:hypothetical protein